MTSRYHRYALGALRRGRGRTPHAQRKLPQVTRATEGQRAVDPGTDGLVATLPHTVPEPPRDGLIERIGWTRVRRAALGLYFVVVAWIVVVYGVPTGRQTLAVIVVGGLILTRLGQGWRRVGLVIVDWLPFTAVLILYDRTRGAADSLGVTLHEADIARAEAWLFGGVNPTVWLQDHLYSPTSVHWYDAVCTLVYTSHFLATPVLAAVLWLRARELWLRFISRVIVLSVAGLVTYVAFPEAPPWMAARDGLLDPVARLSARGWIWLHAGNLDALLARAQKGGANPVAAMPSLHTAFAVLVAIFVAAQWRSRWRYLSALYPFAMGFTLVYTGEHYVLDLVAGVAYALATHVALNTWEARRTRRATAAAT